jgi:type IV pilus assembly protein PilV
MNMKDNNAKRLEQGFSLIEVLVTLLILAIGLLSIAAMQLRGLQYNQDAYMRSQVNMLAYDIADRMRLNRDNVADYVSNYTVTTAEPTACVQGSGSDANNDLECWKHQLWNGLPPGSTASVAVNAGDPDMYDITISWSDRENTARTITYTFQP